MTTGLIFWRVLILVVSYNPESLNHRLQTLERAGNIVIPASTLQSCINAIFNPFHVLIIGASVPQPDRRIIAEESKKVRPDAEIISVEYPTSTRLQFADLVLPARDEGKLLDAVRRLQYGK